MGAIRVAIVGVGNCASSLVQGVEYYKDADVNDRVPGLMHVQFGDYHVRDIEFVAAYDVDAKKVGQDLAHAIVASENNTIKICDVPPSGVTVSRGHTLDGLGKYYREMVTESDEEPVDIVASLLENKVDVLICYLPVGSEQAAKYYAQCAIDAKVAFVNALPVFIAGTPEWAKKFEDAGVPIVPVSIRGTHAIMPKRSWIIRPRDVAVEVGEPIDTSDCTRATKEALMERVRAAIRRGCVCPIRPAAPRPSSRQIFGNCVLLPLPVAPLTIVTGARVMAAAISARRACTGRLSS